MRMKDCSTKGVVAQVRTGGRREVFTARPARAGLHAGMTLVELLVAMVILLVGVWAVAKGFPTLLGAISADQQRTQFARMVEGRLEALRQASWTLPQAFAVYLFDPTGYELTGDIAPDSKPKDPDTYDPSTPNSRDDLTAVLGEWGRIPARQPQNPVPNEDYVLMPVMQGLLDTDWARQSEVFQCYVAERLDPMNFLPSDGIPSGRFFLEWAGTDAGRVWVPDDYDAIRVDYGWVHLNGETHWVQADTVELQAGPQPGTKTAYVSATRAAASGQPVFASVLPGSARCLGLKRMTFVGGNAPAAGEVGIEPTCGAGLVFNAEDAGKVVVVSYRLRCNADGGRDLYMMEEYNLGEFTAQPDPNDADKRLVRVRLGWGGLDKLMDVSEGAQTVPVHVVAVDEVTLNLYYDGAGVAPPDAEALRTGQVTLRVPREALGHKLRFYYRTLDQGTIMVYKPPTVFYEDVAPFVAGPPLRTSLLFEKYGRRDRAVAPGEIETDLVFSVSNVGHTVAVDYLYDADGDVTNGQVQPRMVCGELHTLGASSTGNEAMCRLNQRCVIEIRAVRGVSLRVRAWWRTPTGRLATYEIESIVPPAEAI
ncbi:MAG: type II secretion system GspH family protein [Armatimonadetes bacterium]|nr:type II secretion system GspH family protein [Armatimonadota bacterium]